jgi:hypothetical protein
MNMLKSNLSLILHLFFVSALILVAHQLPELLIELSNQYLKLPPGAVTLSWEAYGVTAVVIILVTFIFERVLSGPRLAKFFRSKRLTAFEGTWVQLTSIPARPISVSFIRYDLASRSWEYSGVGFNRNGQREARWRTFSLEFSPLKMKWYFHGDAFFYGQDPATEVIPVLEMEPPKKDRFTGCVADIGAGGSRNIFDIVAMRRITKPKGFTGDLSSVITISELSPKELDQLISAAKLNQELARLLEGADGNPAAKPIAANDQDQRGKKTSSDAVSH